MSKADCFPREIFLEQFAEIYRGVVEGAPSWVVTNQEGSGVLGSIGDLSAEEASKKPCGHLSIAAHTEHLRWSLAYAHAYFRGEMPDVDWSGSWNVDAVDDRSWRQLRDDLASELEALTLAIEQHEDWSNRDMVAGTLALVSHGAYHLGAIRLLLKGLSDNH